MIGPEGCSVADARYVPPPPGQPLQAALADAVLLRLGLGQEDKAIEDARKFQKNYGASKPAQTAAIAFAIGAHYAEKGDWDNARKNLSGNMSVIDKASPDIQVQAHATLGRVYAKIPQGDKLAKNEYAKVRNIWGDGSKAVEAIRAAHPGDADKAIGKALNAVGEAIFYNADEIKVATVDQIKFPIYVGSGDMKSVKAHIDTKVKGWLEKKKPAIEKAEAEYKKIVDLQPAPPPKWPANSTPAPTSTCCASAAATTATSRAASSRKTLCTAPTTPPWPKPPKPSAACWPKAPKRCAARVRSKRKKRSATSARP